jgi:hypothetical protein
MLKLSSFIALRVLHLNSTFCDEVNERDLVESLRHLHKLERLTIHRGFSDLGEHAWQATELVLPRHFRHSASCQHASIHHVFLTSPTWT